MKPKALEKIAELVAHANSPQSFLGGPHLQIGKVYAHKEGKRVRITSGDYLTYDVPDGIGRICNWWEWEFVDQYHRPTGEKGHGYGWSGTPLEPKPPEEWPLM